MKVIVLALVLVVFVSMLAVFADYRDDSRYQAIMRSVIKPKLLYPVNQEIDLPGKSSLVFQWALYSVSLVRRDYIEFKLYEGSDTNSNNLVFLKKLFPEEYVLAVDNKIFKTDRIYTWSIEQFILRGQSAGKSTASFKVKKGG